MNNFIAVRKMETLDKRLIKCQSEYPHFTKVLVILEDGMSFCYDYINEAINDNRIKDLICVCSFIQKDLLTGRDIIVIYVTDDVY